MAYRSIMYNTSTTTDVGETDSTEQRQRRSLALSEYIVSLWTDRHMGSESQTRKPQEKNPDTTPTPSPHCRLLPVHPPSAPTDQHMWWRMTHLFFYKGCVYVKLLKCIKMSSTLGGPPRLPWKITRWKYNFSSGEPGIWTEFCLSLCVSLPSLPCSLTSFLLWFVSCLFLMLTLLQYLLLVHTLQWR